MPYFLSFRQKEAPQPVPQAFVSKNLHSPLDSSEIFLIHSDSLCWCLSYSKLGRRRPRLPSRARYGSDFSPRLIGLKMRKWGGGNGSATGSPTLGNYYLIGACDWNCSSTPSALNLGYSLPQFRSSRNTSSSHSDCSAVSQCSQPPTPIAWRRR